MEIERYHRKDAPPLRRRMAAIFFVVLLHGFALWALIRPFAAAIKLPPPSVTVVIEPPRTPPKTLPPPPQTTLLRPPVPSLIMPQIAIAAPPPAHAITLPPAQPAAQPSQGAPAKPPLPSNYLARLLAHLNTYKRYPYEARLRREEGTVFLRFTMDRQGHVLRYSVAHSSGSVVLDNEALALIMRAEPLPPVPADYPGDRLDLIVPLIFSLH
jgi:periplasmic protein TonB